MHKIRGNTEVPSLLEKTGVRGAGRGQGNNFHHHFVSLAVHIADEERVETKHYYGVIMYVCHKSSEEIVMPRQQEGGDTGQEVIVLFYFCCGSKL